MKKFIFTFSLTILLFLGLSLRTFGQSNVIYYFPFPAQDLYNSFKTITDAGGATISGPLKSTISIVSSENQCKIIYDQWEDGYEADINNPVQASTKIYGDENLANGDASSFCPTCGGDNIDAGSILTLKNDIPVPRNPAVFLFDGRDKIATTRYVSVSMACYPNTPGSVLADATEVTDTSAFDLEFYSPIGVNMATAVDNDMFNLCQMYIMASSNGTTVQIDADANGTFESTINLNQGESYKVLSINVNAHILANKPIECDLFTSRPGSGSNFENRWFTLYPANLWDNSYYCPLTTTDAGDPASVFLFNPSSSPLTINYTTQTTSGTIVVPAKSTVRYDIPLGTGVRFYTNVLSQKFFAVGAMDTDLGNNSTHDWGMTLLPESYLTTSLLVGYGPGSSDGTQDGNPVWVVATAPTTIYVDYDGIPSTGPLTDPNGNQYNVSYTLNAYESKRIFDPDKDQTGMRIYSIDGTRLAGAWGQDPSSSGCCAPYLDEGTSIPPDLRLVVSKVGRITYDANGNHLVDPGDTITYSIKLENFSLRARNVVTLVDNLSPYVTFASGTAKEMISYLALGITNTILIPDNPNPTTIFPIDEGGYDLGDLLGATKIEVQYKVVANANVTTQPFVSNSITVSTAQGESFATDAKVPVNHSFVGCTMDFTNSSWGSVATYAINSPVYASLNAGYMNADPGVAETVVAVVENTTTSDKENITLTETGVNTGIFRGSLSASTSTGGSSFDGTLKAIAGDNITITYYNSFYDNTCTDNALVGTPILIKQLYLTNNPASQNMNRNYPSGATVSTAVLVGGTPGSVTLNPVADALITAQHATNNYGSDATICNENASSLTRSLLRFDLTPYAGATITSATLTLRRLDSQPTGTAVGLYNVTSAWTEGTGTDPSGIAAGDNVIDVNANTNNVTWNNRTTATAWTTAGGDFNSTAITSGNPPAAADFIWPAGTLATTVQNWVNNSATNYGLLLKNVTETSVAAPTATTRFDFRSREYATVAQRPRLAINYTMPGLVTATFTQNPSMCSNLTLPTGGIVKVKVWLGNITGSMPANPSISATLKNNGVSFLTLSSPVFYDNAGTANDTLVFTGPLVSTQTVLAGNAVSCDITTAQASVTFTVDYNSNTKPSRIDLPTTTVISVNSVAVYDAAYPGGSVITTALNGSTAFVRSVVSDPFGSSDITSMPFTITGPSSYSLSGTATSVATSGCTRTYEYAWTTPTVEGNYNVQVTAKEGSENSISDTKSTVFNLKQSDLGTPCASGFTDIAWNPVTTYAANGTIYVQVIDADQNLNSGSPDNFLVTINAIPNGDIETVTLTETGNATGIFRGSITSNAAANSAGVVYAPTGTVLHLLYTDPNDAADVCNSNASIPLPTPDVNGMVITKTRTSSAIANIGEQVNYAIAITNVGNQSINQLTLTDTYPAANLSFVSSSITPTTNIAGTLTWTGLIPITVGQTKTVDLVFTALSPGIPVTNTAATSNGLYSGGGSLNNKTATANVNITNPDYSIVKSLLLPVSGQACLGANIRFQIVITNTGNTNITSLPMSDTYSNYGMTYVSATPAPTGVGGGMLFWSNLASTPIIPGHSDTVIINLTAANYCGSQINTATVIGATDVNGDALPDKTSDATIIIDDLTLPIIVSCPPNIIDTVDPGSCFATGISLGTITPSDNCGITNIFNDAPAAFPAGTTTVTWSATDAKGNTSTCTQTVTIYDNINPTITCAVPFASYNTDPGHCYFTVPDNGLDPTATADNCAIASVINNFTSTSSLNGAQFPIGTTTVIWTVTDVNGNSANCQYDVTVVSVAAPIIGAITQPTCAVATGSVSLSGLPSGNWTLNPGSIAGNTTTAVLSGLATGTHSFTVTLAEGCITLPTTSFDIDAQPSPPAAATASTTIQPTCALATGTIVVTAPLGAYEYNIDGGAYQASVTFAGVAAGSHNILVRSTADNTCISGPTSVTVNAQPSPPAAATASTTIQPTCALATGTIVVTAPLGAYEYNIDGGAYQASVTFAGVAAGSHNILVRSTADNTCISGPTSVSVNAQPSPPAAATASTTIQPTCALATGTIVVTAPSGAYEYNIDGGAYQASVTFAGIAAGSHSILVRRSADNTCISGPTSVSVNAQPSPPAAATASTTIQPTCALATGTIVVTAPLGAYEYNIDGGAYQASVTFAGIAAGSHNILVRSTADNTCISGPTSVSVNAQPSPPAAATASTTIQPTCALATGTIVVTAPLGAYEYNIDGGAYQASVTFAGIAAGSHSILVRSTIDNACISGPTSVTVNAQPSPPAAATASTTIQPTCALATGTIVVTAPLGAYEYNIDGGAYQASVTFAGVAAGSHNILVRSTADNTCISGPTSVSVNAQPSPPAAATASTTIQPTCASATGTIVVTAPLGAYDYNIDGGAYQASVTFAGVASGSYNILVRSTADNTCISGPTSVSVNAQPSPPTAATASTTIQPTCALATGTIVVTAPLGAYEYNIDGGAYQASVTFAGVAAGSHNILVRSIADNTCISGPTSVSVNAQPSPPAAATASTTIQPTCALATGTIVVTAPLGAYEYNIDGGAYQASVTFAGIAAGSHNILVRSTADNTCISVPTSVSVNAQPSPPAAATASTTIQPTCALATGTIVVTAPLGAYEYNIDGGAYQASVTFAGVASSSHNILVRSTADNTCISGPTSVTVNAQPSPPSAATASTTIQPTCALATGTIVVTAPLGAYEYNIDGGAYQASVTFAGVATGSHNILVRRTPDNTCISGPTSVTVNAQPSPPAAATASTTIQPTCALATGSIVVTAPLGAYEYNIDGGAYQASVTFAGIAAGSHNILVRSTADNTCISGLTSVSVNAQPSPPAAATASATIQPTCALATGTIVVTAPLGAYEYNIDGGAYQASVTFTGIAAGSHNILVRRSADNTCISVPTSVSVNAQPSPPVAATASTTIQPTCALATGTIVVTAPLGAYEYNIDGGAYQASVTFAGIAAGSHNILVRSTADNTCISGPTSVTVNAQPSPPSAATASTTIQPTCALATGTIVVTAPLGAYEYNIDGGAYQASVTFAGVATGSHNILVRRTPDNTCISGPTSVTVNAQPSPPAVATASTTIQPTCALATGSIVVTAPLGAYEYNIDGGAYQASVTFAGIAAGSHNILVRSTADNTCISGLTSVSVNAQPSPPAAATASATIQPTCALATGTIVVTAPLGAYEYNIDGGAYQASVTFTGIAAGSHNILVRRSADNTCISVPTSVSVNAQPSPPVAATASTTIQPTCALATGTIVVTAPLGAYEYNIDGGAYQASVTFAGIAAGSHNILVRSTIDNACISGPTSVTVNAQPSPPAAATASTTIQPTCALATGTIVVTAPLGAYEYNIDGGAYQASVTFAGVAAGSHNILVRSTIDNACISGPTSVSVNAQPSPPTAATASTTIQPTCALATGTIVVTAPLGAYEYNIDGGAYQASVTFAGIAVGSHNILVRSTADITCISGPTSVTVNAQPSPPSAATASTTIQPTCALATGTLVVTAPLGAYEYNIDGGAYQASVTFAGIAAGSHNILVRRSADNTCISGPTSVTVNAQPSPPAAATASTTIQPTCALATGTIVVTAPLGTYEYNIDGGAYQASVTFAGVAAGSHNILVRSTADNTCISGPTSLTVNAQPLTPSAPIVGNIIQPLCSVPTGSVDLGGLPAGNWTLNPGSINGNTAGTTITGLAPGTYNYTVTNASGCISLPSGNVVIIAAPNCIPIAVNDVNTTNEDTPVNGDVSTNDTLSVDGGNAWSLSGVNGGATNGIVTMNNDGTYTFTPNLNYNGSDVFSYQVCDVDIDCSTATVTITINAVNDPPIANNVNGAILIEDGPNGTVNVLSSDTDPDGNPTAPVNGFGEFTVDLDPGTPGIQSTFTDAQGVWTLNTATGDVTFDPANNYNGTAVIPYTLCDPTGLCDNANIIFVVSPVNDMPIAVNDVNTTNEDTPVNGDVSANDTPSGDGGNVWTLSGVYGGAVYGTVTMNNDGTYTYTPFANFNGSDVFTYQLCDVDMDCSVATVTITIVSVNDPPLLFEPSATTMEDSVVTVCTIIFDPDAGNTFSASLCSPPLNGTVTSGPTVTGNKVCFTYMPNLGFNGLDNVCVIVCDNTGLCDTSTSVILVLPINEPPVADPDNFTTNEDTPIYGTVITNDVDPDGNLNPNGYSIVNGPSNGTLNFNYNGTFTYTPNANYNGTDTFIYSVCDVGMPVYCDTALVTINVLPVDNPPVIAEPMATTPEETPVIVCATITDPDAGNTFVAGICAPPANGTLTSGPTVVGNQVCFTYLPNVNFSGTDNVCIIVCDNTGLCDTSTSVITVVPVNDPPVADPDYFTTNEDTPLTGTVISNDGDVDGNLNPTGYAIVSGPTNGTINFSNNGTFTYTPNLNYNDTENFIYMVCDLGMPIYCDTALVTINIIPVNDPPIAVDDIATTPEDTPVSGNILTNDSDPEGDALTVVDFIINGTTYPADGSIVTIPGVGTIVIDLIGNYTLTPDLNFNGPVPTVTYTIADGNGGSDAANLNIFVGMVNDPPIAVNDTIIANEDTPVNGNALTNDSDIDGGPLSVVSFIVNGVTYPAGATVNMPGFGVVTLYNNGLFIFSPAPDFNGSVPIIPYTITDGNGGLATADIIITITPVDDPPVLSEPTVVSPEDTQTTVCTNILDPDAGNTFAASLCGPPSNGTITSGPTIIGNQVCFTYLPNADFNGIENVCVIVCDNTGLCDTSSAIINVLPVNDPPVANPDYFATNEDTPVTGTVIANDSDIDGNLNPNGYAIVSYPANGTIIFSNNGTFTYTPNSNYFGPDSFIYSVCDLGIPVYCDTAIVNLDIAPVNDAPVVFNEQLHLCEGSSSSINVLANGDFDTEGTSVAVDTLLLFGPINGTATLSSGGTLTYTPFPGYFGSDYVVVSVCDQGIPLPASCSNDTIFITVDQAVTAFAGNDQEFCDDDMDYITLNGNFVSNSNDLWTQISGPAALITSSNTNSAIAYINHVPGTYVFQYDMINGTCSSSDQVSYTVWLPPSIADAGPDQNLCADTSTIISANAPLVGTGLWAQVSGPNSASITDPNLPMTTITGLIPGTYVLSWTITNGPFCAPSVDQVVITIASPINVSAGPDDTICEGSNYFLSNATTTSAVPVHWTTSGTGQFSNSNILNPVYTPSPNDILDGQVDLTLTINSAGPCPNTGDVMTLTINHQAIVDAGPDMTICETQGSYSISGSSSQNAFSYQWTTSGSGTFTNGNTLHPAYTPSPADIISGSVTLTMIGNSAAPCVSATDAMVLNISRQAVISAGPDATICESGTYFLSGSSAQFASTIHWTTTGTGIFNNSNTLAPVYTPSQNDIIDGWVYLVLTATSVGPCAAVADTMRLDIMHQTSNVFAGADATICETASYTLNDATAINASSLLWTTSGTGSFNNSSLLHPTYLPSPSDVAAGSITLTLTASSASPCTTVSDFMTLSFALQAISSAGPDDVVCEGSSYTLSGATATNATSTLWTTSGSGTFANPSILHAIYTPSPADILNGSLTLTLVTTSQLPCGNAAADAMLLTISHKPVISAGADTAICQNVNYYVDDATAIYSTGVFWTTTGTGTMLNGGTLNPTYVPGPGETGAIRLTLNAISSLACGSDTTSDFMYLTIMQSVIANAGQDTTIFANNSVALHGSATQGSGAYSYNWQPASLLIFENTDHPISNPLAASTVFVVTVTDLVTGCQDVDTVVVTVDGINLPPLATNDYDTTEYQTCLTFPILLNDYDPENTPLTVSLCGPPIHGIVVINSDNTLTYCPYDGFSGDDTLCYQICDHGSPVLCDQATVFIHVKPEFTLDDLIIYNGVSPNRDGDNDVWNIYGIEFFPDNEVTIFNRWGDIVANYTHYNNKDIAWGATYKGNLVPDGTYYYLLDIKNKKKFAGWIYVKTGK